MQPFFIAQKELTPNELFDILPVTYPMTHQLLEFPGIAMYPTSKWEDAGSPTMTVKGWAKLCMRVAAGNLTSLGTVFEIAKQYDPDSTPGAASSSL